jgi:hypothetical protein
MFARTDGPRTLLRSGRRANYHIRYFQFGPVQPNNGGRSAKLDIDLNGPRERLPFGNNSEIETVLLWLYTAIETENRRLNVSRE